MDRITPLADTEDINDDRYNEYIREKIIIGNKSNNGGNLATVIRRATDESRVKIGQAHRKPIMDTRKFEVDLENGETNKIMTNQIAANLYYQLEYEGRGILQFKGIINHNKDWSDLTKEPGFTIL